MRALRNFAAAFALVFAAGHACAAPMSPDPSGMWYDPKQPGWGLSLSQQGDNIFAVLFVYDANHQPEWFVASNVVASGEPHCIIVGVAGCALSQPFSGPLYRTNGPYFGSSSDSTPMQAAPVGTLQVLLTGGPGSAFYPAGLAVTYTVNATLVTKIAEPQVWSDLSNAFGTYNGGFVKTTASGACNASQVAMLAPNPAQFSLDMDGPQFAVSWGTDTSSGGGGCTVIGTPDLLGSLTNVPGQLRCANGTTGSSTLSNLSVGSFGFTANLSLSASGGCADLRDYRRRERVAA